MKESNSIFQPSVAASAWYRSRDICKIQQSEIAFTQDTMRIISSSGAGPCVILILYDRMSQQGFMTHLFAATEISPYTAGGKWLIQKCLERYQHGVVDFYLIGGYSLISTLLIHAIEHCIHVLRDKINVQHIYRHLRQNWVSHIVFDFNTAELFYYQSNKDNSPRRPINRYQAIRTSCLHLFPCGHLLEYMSDGSNYSDQERKKLL